MAGVYISYPFCSQKCTFCNFASDVYGADKRLAYHAALLREVRAHAWQWMPETLYLGGGTPSLMPLDLLGELLASIPGNKLTEVTMECAPGTITREKVLGWRAAGVNRVSLGVQSFDAVELRHSGRRHTAQVVEDDVAVLRECGIANINIDLIAGLPHQSRGSWDRSLEALERLAVPHASIYLFEIDEDSRLGREILLGGQRYSAAFLPNEALAADLYCTAVERLRNFGLDRYEISNFSKPGFESRHNLKYWLREPYTGFGLDAHSFDGQLRWGNPDDLDVYLNGITVQEKERAIEAEEHFFVGLRMMKGIRPSAEEWQMFAEPIQRWTEAGMLMRDGDCLRLSDGGVLVSNEIFQEFLHV